MGKPLLYALFLLLSQPLAAVAAEGLVSPDRAQALAHLVKHDCGSCHGMTLRGGLGPALTVDRLKERPLSQLQTIILEGVPTTAMPPWRGILTEAEASWIADYLKELK